MIRNGTYVDRNGDKVKVTITETGYRIENLRTNEVTFVGQETIS